MNEPLYPGAEPRRIARVLLFLLGASSIFWLFFRVIGILIGVLFFALLHDPRWRLHGLVLALCAAISGFVAHTGSALEPLHLAMRTGPAILAACFLAWLVGVALTRLRATREGRRQPAGRCFWVTACVPRVLLATIQVEHPVSRVQYVDPEPVTGTSCSREQCVENGGRFYTNRYSDNPVDPESLPTGGADCHLIRVVGGNGRIAYTGPIWVSSAP